MTIITGALIRPTREAWFTAVQLIKTSEGYNYIAPVEDLELLFSTSTSTPKEASDQLLQEWSHLGDQYFQIRTKCSLKNWPISAYKIALDHGN